MALLTISGEPASRWEEVAHGAAQMLGFDLVTESRLTQWLNEEFGPATIPDKAWKPAVASVLARLATAHHMVIAVDGAEQLTRSMPLALSVWITASAAVRTGNVMLDERLERPAAQARIAEMHTEAKRLRKVRFGRTPAAGFDIALNTATLDPPHAAEVIATAARRLSERGLLTQAAASEIQFETRLRLARHGIAPAGAAHVQRAVFGHPSEEMFAHLLDFYRIPWDYEPRSFPLQWDKDGNVTEAFTPDFYLPDFDLYVELTTMKQSLVTKKNRKIKLLRAIYPHVNIQVFYQKDYQDLVFKHGWKAS